MAETLGRLCDAGMTSPCRTRVAPIPGCHEVHTALSQTIRIVAFASRRRRFRLIKENL